MRAWSQIAAITVIALGALLPTSTSASAEPPRGEASWVSAGDSYSSGEGVRGNQGACAQSDKAYGPLAADLFRVAGWNITAEAFTACTGHFVEDLFNPRPGSNKDSLWDWGLDQGAPDRTDVLSLSFGGNDIGFADVLLDCLPIADSWLDAYLGVAFTGLPIEFTGCDTPEEDVNDRIAALLDPPRRDCRGGRHENRRVARDPGFDCDLLIDDGGTSGEAGDDVRGSIVDFYVRLVEQHLTDRGHLVVVGYPNIFAPPEEWPGWVQIQCQGITRGDAERIGRMGAALDDALARAVQRANRAIGEDRVHYLPRSLLYRDGSHELCGTGDDWLNGVDFNRGGGRVRLETAFHPNAAGHAATAAGLTRVLNELTFDQPTLGVVWGSYQEGYGEVRPGRIFNGGSPTGLVTDVVWDSWGEETATGRGLSVWDGAETSVADTPLSEAVVTAFDLGECDGQLAYRALNWYFPDVGETYDPERYINICTGDYVRPEPPPPANIDPEAVGRAFIDAWGAGDTAQMSALSDPISWSGIASNTQQLRPRGPATSCFLHGGGTQYQCDAVGLGGELLYVLMNPDGAGGWWVSWAAQSNGF